MPRGDILTVRLWEGVSYDPPAWALQVDDNDRVPDIVFFLNAPSHDVGVHYETEILAIPNDRWEAVLEDQVPDDVWAALAAWRLTGGAGDT